MKEYATLASSPTVGPRLLHITDTHMLVKGSDLNRDDANKVNAKPLKLNFKTREALYDYAFLRLAEHLKKSSLKLDAVVFSGDALARGERGGDELLRDKLLKHLKEFGIQAGQIVAVPGNHDMPRGSEPSTEERYDRFKTVWRDAGCITPWLDGVDSVEGVELKQHVLLPQDKLWAIIALNSCNWSQTTALSPELGALWDSIPSRLTKKTELRKQFDMELQKLKYFDMARVSDEQLTVLRYITKQLDSECDDERRDRDAQLRMLVMHHHLRAPDHTEEVKAFAEVTNLELVRTVLAQQNISIVMHGHKHSARKHFDHIELKPDQPLHRVLMLSGGTASPQSTKDAMSLVEFSGLPWVPEVKTTSITLPRPGVDIEFKPDDANGRLWPFAESCGGAPVTIQGKDYNQVYERIKLAAQRMGTPGTLVVHLDLPESGAEDVKRLPTSYPRDHEHFNATDKKTDESRQWLEQLVEWWQKPMSLVQSRVPYRHGERLQRFSKNIDQLLRARQELLRDRKTTRAIALLIDPAIDFVDAPDGSKTEFASFCLVQFKRRKAERGAPERVDCVAYYRAQEVVKWWPVNVAELRHIQEFVVKDTGWSEGRITTITAEARWEASRPSDVAVPVVDRWIDQAPEKLFVIAHAMLSVGQRSESELAVSREWIRCLQMLLDLAEDAKNTRSVVSIEGPRQVAKYLRSGSGPEDQRANIETYARELENVADCGHVLQTATAKNRKEAAASLALALKIAVGTANSVLLSQQASKTPGVKPGLGQKKATRRAKRPK